MDANHITRCPACGGTIFCDLLVRSVRPGTADMQAGGIARVVYVTDVVLDQHGSPVMWRQQGADDLMTELDVRDFEETIDPHLYCEAYHPVRGLVLGATLARLREPLDPSRPRAQMARLDEDAAAAWLVRQIMDRTWKLIEARERAAADNSECGAVRLRAARCRRATPIPTNATPSTVRCGESASAGSIGASARRHGRRPR